MKILETRKVRVDEIVFHQAFYPRTKPDTATIEQYVDMLQDGAEFPPLELDADGMVLLDGYHRWKAFMEAGVSTIDAKLIALEGMPRLLYAASRNAIHGDRLAMSEKRAVARQMAEQGITQTEIQKWLHVSVGTVNAWVSDIVTRSQREREGTILWLDVLGWTQAEIAERIGCDQSSISRVCKSSDLKNRILEQRSRGRGASEIAETECVSLQLVEAILLANLSDAERLNELRIGIQPYDVWNFSGCDPRFGGEYPGRIPGQLVLHVLYFFSQPNELVLDPMAGSGTTMDACAYLGRRVYGLDAHPFASRSDILEHDMFKQGWPSRTAQAQLIFWDPPYFKKKDAAYGDKSISRLEKKDYLAFFKHAAQSIPKKFCGRLALLCSDYNDESDTTQNIFGVEYVNLFLRAGWTLERRIQVPLTTQQVHPDVVNRFRQERRLARLNRDVVVLRHD